MKIQTGLLRLILIIYVTLTFLIPPLTVSEAAVSAGPVAFPFSTVVYFLIALSVIFFSNKLFDFRIHEKSENEKYFFIKRISWGNICLGLLFLTYVFFLFFSIVLNLPAQKSFFSKPETFLEYCFCLLNFVLAAFNEEVIYRFFMPEALSNLNKSKRWKVFCEILIVLIFALAHRYQGFLSVIFAFFSACILRMCFIKSKSIFPCYVSHLIFNLLSFIFLITQ